MLESEKASVELVRGCERKETANVMGDTTSMMNQDQFPWTLKRDANAKRPCGACMNWSTGKRRGVLRKVNWQRR